ncbi:hypothetical protein FS837_009355 [Tulasnella sp. UAMH 9824]|nr:hypothetical protein FS837_009355 [Tulasnella sp. UAMH 9824]
MPRTPLSHRLGSLFSSRAPSPAVNEAASSSRTSLPSSNTNQLSKATNAQSSPFAQVVQAFNALRGVEESPPKVVRRLSEEVDTTEPPRPRRGRPGNSSVDEATKEALREAIADSPFDYSSRPMANLPEPPQAFLPTANPMPTFHSIQTGQALKHPILLDNLGRSTFPSLALTDTHLQPRISPSPAPVPPSFPYLGLSTSPTRTSLDALRSLRERDEALQGLQSAHIHTSTLHPPVRGSTLESFTPSLPTNWWWNNKSEVDQLLREDDQAPTAQEEEAKIRERYCAPKNPVVFCHGLLGFDTVTLGASFVPLQISHWRGIKEVLEANGAEVLITRVPATSSPAERAGVLAKIITERYKGRSVHLIGHSMGGIDCRYVASHLQGEDTFKVLSVTTVASPHRGSYFADYFLDTLGERLPTMLSFLDMLPNGGGDGQAFVALTLDNMKKFNEETPDAPGVQYFSWGAEFEPGLLDPFRFPHSIVLPKEGPNDGLVSLSSARWGTYLGTLKGVSHLDLVGWVNTARYTWAEWTGRSIKFKPATFYLEVADHLARVVEGVKEGEEPPPRLKTRTGTSETTRTEDGGEVME